MIIIAGYSLIKASKRDAAVRAFAEMVDRCRQFEGCLDVSIAADSVDPRRINVFELWRDKRSLDRWREIADPPKVNPIETHVKLYRASKAEKPF